jgi:thioredoxin 1
MIILWKVCPLGSGRLLKTTRRDFSRKNISKQNEGVCMAGNVAEISDVDFDEKVLKASTLVVVDFWAPWCGPCKSIAPVLEEIAKELGTQIAIFKVNVDDNPKSPSQYGVRAIPNLVMFKGGAEVDRVVGAVPKDQLVATIKKAL